MNLQPPTTYVRDWLVNPDGCYDQLADQLDWQTQDIHVYGRWHQVPRLVCWYGPHAYTYSQTSLPPCPMPQCLAEICQRINSEFELKLNSALGNWYRDGTDHMGYHSDDEAELGPYPVVASVSLGAERELLWRLKPGSRLIEQHGKGCLAKSYLEHGSLLVMQAGCQEQWQHALPKRKRVEAGRINLTFRQIIAG